MRIKLPTIGSILDWIKRWSERIKTIVAAIALLGVIISVVSNGCTKNELVEKVAQVTGLNVLNKLLKDNVSELDSLNLAKDIRIAEISDSLKAKEEELQRIKSLYSHLEDDYSDLSGELIRITSDSSYQFLQRIAYPFPGELKYPFNEPQVKGIHLTFLENNKLIEMNDNLVYQVEVYEDQLTLRDEATSQAISKALLMTEAKADQNKIIINQASIITIQEEQIEKEGKRKGFWKVTTIILGVIATILAV